MTTTYDLMDYETGERIGPATAEQVEASLAAGAEGCIALEGGSVLGERLAGRYRAIGWPVRTAYVVET